MKEIRYSHEDALNEAEKIKNIVGNKAETDDYNLANQLLEDEKGRDRKRWLEHFDKGYITIFPATGDKNIMIGINTKDKIVFNLFDIAAREVTKKYKGFHQLGANSSVGETAWELWDLPDSKYPTQVIDEIYSRMLELESEYIKLDLIDELNK